jgi:hypothetical protein
MRVSVEHHVDRMTVEWLLQAARAQIGEDLQRLALDRGADRGVVQHGDAPGCTQPRQGAFELERLVNRLLDKSLGGRLAPRTERRAPKAAGKPLGAGDAGALDLMRLAVEHFHTRLGEDPADLHMLARLVVVITEHSDYRNGDGSGQLSGQNMCFLRQAIVGEITAQQENIRLAVYGGQQRLQRTLRGLFDMQVADCCQARCLLTVQLGVLEKGRGAICMPTGPPDVHEFYLRTMEALRAAGLPYLVGGGYALGHYTGVPRDAKDFDIFVRREDYDAIMKVLSQAGYQTELTFPHWLGKVACEQGYIDVIFNSGNGVSRVDDGWFEHAAEATVLGIPVRLCPVEEMIWSKAYIMERERYDAADIMHLVLARAEQIDWERLIKRFGPHWRVLFSHLCLFGFIYPAERERIPAWVMMGLIRRLEREMRTPPPTEKTCQGTLLSREQYLIDVERWGLADARHTEASSMTPNDVVLWTQAIDSDRSG